MFFVYLAVSIALSLVILFGQGGLLYYLWYMRRRGDAASWKCQPNRWLSPELTRHAIVLGALNLVLGGVISGSLAYHAFHGGWTQLYFSLDVHGLPYTIASTALVFVVTDAAAYFAHRCYHRPAAFRLIHRWHHRYNAPIPFTVTAMHPIEFVSYQLIFIAPMFAIPMHVAAYYGMLVYVFYFTTWDHSGIKHRSFVPWQPPSLFHDDHHKYFHCNYGQNAMLWDRLFGTLRRRNRRYGAEVFGGRGAGGEPDDKFVDYR